MMNELKVFSGSVSLKNSSTVIGFLVTVIFNSRKEVGGYSQLYLSAKLTDYF